MSKFDSLIKLSANDRTAVKVKAEIDKIGAAEKPPVTGINAINLAVFEEGIGLIHYLVKQKEIKLLEVVLGLLDKSQAQEIADLLVLPITEAVTSNHAEIYDLLTQYVGEYPSIIFTALRYSNHRFIMHLLKHDVKTIPREAVLEIAQNQHDLTYLLGQLPFEWLCEARDGQRNNILHLALQNRNKNIFSYVVNHPNAAVMNLLYELNSNDITPIDMVYDDIAKAAENNKTSYDFSLLMLLDQAGADLQTTKHANVLSAYKAIPEYHHQFLLAKQVQSNKTVEAVSFNGGGAKGQAFIAAYREALERGVIHADQVTQFAGTSAGAITAGVFALNFDITRCEHELNIFDFEGLMSKTSTDEISAGLEILQKWKSYYRQGAFYSLITDIITQLASESIGWRSTPILDLIKKLSSKVTGIYTPITLRTTLEGLVKERITDCPTLANLNPAHITFKDLQDHPQIFKKLTVYITNLTTGKLEKCSAETTPDMSIIDGIVYSASFPIFFEAAQKFKIVTNEQGVRSREPVLINGETVWCCDGGVLKNDPVDAFDVGNFNERTLTFMLVSSDSKKAYELGGHESLQPITSSIHVLGQLYKISRSMERKNLHDDLRNHSRIVYIDTKNVGTLDFDQAKKNAPVLAAAGQDAVIDYLNRRTANGYSSLSPETISLLISCGIARYSTSGRGQVIEINPGKKLSPVQILRIYAAATDTEVLMLRSIVNPNQLDDNGVSARSIASHCKFVKTEQRLQIAGARPSRLDVQHDALPAHFKRGEKFLLTAVSDVELLRVESLHAEREKLETEKKELQDDWNKERGLFEVEREKLTAEKQQSAEQIVNLHAVIQQAGNEKQQVEAEKEQLANLNLQLETEQSKLNDEKLKLQATLENERNSFKTENEKLASALQVQQKTNMFLQRKYQFIRNAPTVRNVINALNAYRQALSKEYEQGTFQFQNSRFVKVSSWYKSYREAKLRLKLTKMFGIDEVVSKLQSDHERSAAEIIKAVKQDKKYRGFFDGVLSHRTKTLCKQVIKTEENIIRAYGR